MTQYEVKHANGSSLVKADGMLLDDGMVIFFEDKACQKEPAVAAFAQGCWWSVQRSEENDDA